MGNVVEMSDYSDWGTVVKGEAQIDAWSHIMLMGLDSELMALRDAGLTELNEPLERLNKVMLHLEEWCVNTNYLVEKAIDKHLTEEEKKGHIPTQPSFDSSSVEKVYDQKVVVLRNVNGVIAAYAVGEGDKLTRLDENEESKIE